MATAKGGRHTSVAANPSPNSAAQIPAACLARKATKYSSPDGLDDLLVRLHSTGRAVLWIETQRIVIQS